MADNLVATQAEASRLLCASAWGLSIKQAVGRNNHWTEKSIYDGGVRLQKLHVIALAQAEMVGDQLRSGNLEGALATARSIEYISIRDQAFRDVAEGQAQAGNLNDALATAESIEADH